MGACRTVRRRCASARSRVSSGRNSGKLSPLVHVLSEHKTLSTTQNTINEHDFGERCWLGQNFQNLNRRVGFSSVWFSLGLVKKLRVFGIFFQRTPSTCVLYVKARETGMIQRYVCKCLPTCPLVHALSMPRHDRKRDRERERERKRERQRGVIQSDFCE